jgi:hypothetical protein
MGFFLMHMLRINLHQLGQIQKAPLVFVLALAISIGVATISFRFFECLFLRWKDRITKFSRPSPVDAASIETALLESDYGHRLMRQAGPPSSKQLKISAAPRWAFFSDGQKSDLIFQTS